MIRVALLVAGKDLRVERRSRVLLWQVVPFGVMALLLCGLALGPDQAGHSSAAPGLFYLVIVLVALLMINRSHAIEATPAAPERRSRRSGWTPRASSWARPSALAVELWLTAIVLLAGSCAGAAHGPPRDARGDCPASSSPSAPSRRAGTLYGALTSGGNAAATLLPVLSLPAFAPLADRR